MISQRTDPPQGPPLSGRKGGDSSDPGPVVAEHLPVERSKLISVYVPLVWSLTLMSLECLIIPFAYSNNSIFFTFTFEHEIMNLVFQLYHADCRSVWCHADQPLADVNVVLRVAHGACYHVPVPGNIRELCMAEWDITQVPINNIIQVTPSFSYSLLLVFQ